MECLRTPYIVPWHPWPGRCPSARTHVRVRADTGVLSPGNFKKDATVLPSHRRPRGHRPIVRPSVRKRPRDTLTLSGCVVAFILFYEEVEGCIGVYTDWDESKVEIFQQVQYGELATFRKLAEWVTRFTEEGVNWSDALPEVARTRAHYGPVPVINGGIFPVGTHRFLADQEFQVQYARFLADMIARCWVWTTGPR
jgi:hypothetical protein